MLIVTCLALAIASAKRGEPATVAKASSARISNPVPSGTVSLAAPDQPGYMRRGSLSPDVREILSVHGDRFERPGKERLVLTGTLTRPNTSEKEAHAYRIVAEFPARLRFEEQVGASLQVIVFNQGQALKRGGPITSGDQDTLETLVFDSVDHFFGAQMNGFALRPLGNRFRLDGGSDEEYTGPVYEVYRLLDEVVIGPDARQQQKLFYFNSNSLLLERVSYETKRDGGPLTVEVEFGNWTNMNGQKLPGLITRRENGEQVFALTITAVAVTGRVSDGSFDRP